MGVTLKVICKACKKEKKIYFKKNDMFMNAIYVFKCDCGVQSHFKGDAYDYVASKPMDSLEAFQFETDSCTFSEFPVVASANTLEKIEGVHNVAKLITYIEWLGSKISNGAYVVTLDNPLTLSMLNNYLIKKLTNYAGKRILISIN